MDSQQEFELQCPLPSSTHSTILMAHGGGGRLMQELIQRVFHRAFGNQYLSQAHDGAVCPFEEGRLAVSTDSYVVRPLVFPGGDIGCLAVYGTVNDLAMCGATPLYLSAGFILEEGFPVEMLEQVATSMAEAARATGVLLVTGDTKVVDRGKGDGVYINTTGVGVVPRGVDIHPARVSPGDLVVLSGDLGAHGIAVLSVREGLDFSGSITSDVAPVHAPVGELIGQGVPVSCLRDLTRGGLASALNEIAETAQVSISIDEGQIPVLDPVRGACEILGLDPLYVANEGRFVAFVPAAHAATAVHILRRHPVSGDARVIGRVSEPDTAPVTLRTALGTSRILDMLSGEQLPRIC